MSDDDDPASDRSISWSEGMRRLARLLEQARGGSSSKVGELLDACRDYLLLVAGDELASDLRQKIAPSDVVQETLVEAYQAFADFGGCDETDLLRWLRRILLNNIIDKTRGYRETAKRDIGREISINGDGSHDNHVKQLAVPEPSPSGYAMAAERRERMFQAIDRLGDKSRQVIRLRNLEQLTFSEIGRRMNLSEDGARKVWTRAIKRLAEELREREDGPP